MEKKITKAEMFNAIKAVVADNAEMVEFIDHELELLARKSANKKPTKAQVENEGLKVVVLDTLSTFAEGATATEIANANPAFAGMSNQKMTALLRSLIADGKVVKTTNKNKSVFSVAVEG